MVTFCWVDEVLCFFMREHFLVSSKSDVASFVVFLLLRTRVICASVMATIVKQSHGNDWMSLLFWL